MQTRSITSNFNSIQRNILSYLLQEINNNNCTVLTGSRQERVYHAYNVFNFILHNIRSISSYTGASWIRFRQVTANRILEITIELTKRINDENGKDKNDKKLLKLLKNPIFNNL